MMCMNSIFKNNQVGKAIQISLALAQVESGKSFHLLEHPGSHIPYLTPTWITSLGTFLGSHHMAISQNNTPIATLCSDNDSLLMDSIQLAGMTVKEQRQVNQCRMYLGVTTVSDIATADGRMVSAETLQGQTMTDRISPLKWPSQHSLSIRQCQLWTRYITNQFVSNNRHLRIPLEK